jgi:hypothetical protein
MAPRIAGRPGSAPTKRPNGGRSFTLGCQVSGRSFPLIVVSDAPDPLLPHSLVAEWTSALTSGGRNEGHQDVDVGFV